MFAIEQIMNFLFLYSLLLFFLMGGFGLETNFQKAGDYYQQAGDLAMESMKGKLATTYNSSAEQYWSMIE